MTNVSSPQTQKVLASEETYTRRMCKYVCVCAAGRKRNFSTAAQRTVHYCVKVTEKKLCVVVKLRRFMTDNSITVNVCLLQAALCRKYSEIYIFKGKRNYIYNLLIFHLPKSRLQDLAPNEKHKVLSNEQDDEMNEKDLLK